ncbi:hypothetical protein H0I23_14290 [Cellulophaga sp. HaHaR_3_176]|uniref:hypothetical protein n=1 Tax=Cellulophaga sp. HaHaR_3_176 TaxID=1942464 RepID=UPI001C1F219C|nr:hypothetical protein [Cellulophaga sp. HaHaR_3_176]QWX83608.1 hypothetical protein H0I23_14290 [Cellulophaga sp. HaHaR_3_176]
MKNIFYSLIVLFYSNSVSSQVTEGLLVNIHSVTEAEMNALEPNSGSLVYNTTDTSIYVYGAGAWVRVNSEAESKTVILNRDGGNLPTATNTFFDLPVDARHVQNINTSYFNVSGTGEITILQDGNYLISGELSTTNMPSGSTKFILAVFINGARRGYLSRGFASLPNQDYWGTTGVLMYQLNANDIISIQYVINAEDSTLSANFSNIGITKL